MEELKTQLESCAIDLVVRHNIKQKQMHEWITNALKEYVNGQEHVKLLFNNCYGGFRFSKPFIAYLQEQDNLITEECHLYDTMMRVKAVPYISPFAVHILNMEQYNGLKNILYIYHLHSLDVIFKKVQRVIQLTKNRSIILDNLDKIATYVANINDMFARSEVSVINQGKPGLWNLKVPLSKTKISSFSCTQLKELLCEYESSDLKKEINDDLKGAIEALILTLGKSLFEEIEDFLDIQLNREKESHRHPEIDKYKYSSFISILSKEGYHSDLTWKYQMVYNQYAIKYLIDKYMKSLDPSHQHSIFDFVFNEECPVDIEVMKKVEETFGLLCASGGCAKLAIATVPPLLEWEVREYDGLENVHVL